MANVANGHANAAVGFSSSTAGRATAETVGAGGSATSGGSFSASEAGGTSGSCSTTAGPRSRARGGRETTGLMLRIFPPTSRAASRANGVIWTSSVAGAGAATEPFFIWLRTRSFSSGEMLASGEFLSLIPAALQCSIKSLLSIPSSFARAKVRIFKSIATNSVLPAGPSACRSSACLCHVHSSSKVRHSFLSGNSPGSTNRRAGQLPCRRKSALYPAIPPRPLRFCWFRSLPLRLPSGEVQAENRLPRRRSDRWLRSARRAQSRPGWVFPDRSH